MNTRNRQISYRRKRQTKRTVATVLIVLGIVLALLFVAFVIIGNRMLKRAESTPPTEPNETKEEPSVEYAAPAAIGAYPVLAETTDSSTFYSRMLAAKEKGATAISLPMTDAQGRLLYKSAVATTLSLQIDSPYRVSAASLVEQARSNGLYLSGIYLLRCFEQEDELLRSVSFAQHAAVLAEALRAGMDDVLLIVPSMTVEQRGELLRFVEQLRALAPDAVVGLALPESILSHAQVDDLLAELDAQLNYLAFDVTRYGENDPAAFVDAQVHSSQNQYRFLYYNMRLLLPDGADDAQQTLIVEAAKSNGVKSWQILPSVCVEKVEP